MAKAYEPSAQELLSQEFPEPAFSTPEPQSQTMILEEDTKNSATHSEYRFTEQNLFSVQEEEAIAPKQVSKENAIARINNIKSIFGTVKSKVIYWFENVDDTKLDSE